MRIVSILTMMALLCGCGAFTKPQKGGGASVSPIPSKSFNGQINPSSDGFMGMPVSTITQPDNPNSESSQSVDHEYEEVVIMSSDTTRETVTSYPDGRSITIKEPIPAGSQIVKRSRSAVNQAVGGSWKDTAREISAALGSFRPVQFAGIAFLAFGAVSFFHPILRRVIGGKDVAMAIAGCGAVMMFGPFLFVQYSQFFFLAILAAGGYWLIARFKYLHGAHDTLKATQPPPPSQ